MLIGRTLLGAVVGLAVSLLLADARAQDDSQCIDAHVRAQRLRRDRKLRAAHAALVSCARPACPRPVVEECAAWLPEVERAVPSVVIEAHASDGRDVADVRVLLDGEPLLEHLDGGAVDVDPGEHVFRFERARSAAVEQRVVVTEGEHGRRLSVRFEPVIPASPAPVWPAASRTAPNDRPTPTLTYVLGAVGIVGLGAAATFGFVGIAKRSDLDGEACKPNCASSEVDGARRAFAIADVSLAVGVGALATALVVYLTRPKIVRSQTAVEIHSPVTRQ